MFALLHAESSAVDMIRKSHAGAVLMLTESVLPRPEAIAQALGELMTDSAHDAAVDPFLFGAYTARESTRVLARALDEALSRTAGR